MPDIETVPAQPPTASEAASEAAEQTEPDAGPAVDAPAETRRLPRLLVATSAAMAALLMLSALLILLRDPILAALPGARAMYGAVGLAPSALGAGLEIRDVTSSRDRQGAEDLLLVSGVVVNVGAQQTAVPALLVSLWNGDDLEVRSVLLTERPSMLQPDAQWPFDAAITDPPADARRIRVGFVEDPARR